MPVETITAEPPKATSTIEPWSFTASMWDDHACFGHLTWVASEYMSLCDKHGRTPDGRWCTDDVGKLTEMFEELAETVDLNNDENTLEEMNGAFAVALVDLVDRTTSCRADSCDCGHDFVDFEIDYVAEQLGELRQVFPDAQWWAVSRADPVEVDLQDMREILRLSHRGNGFVSFSVEVAADGTVTVSCDSSSNVVVHPLRTQAHIGVVSMAGDLGWLDDELIERVSSLSDEAAMTACLLLEESADDVNLTDIVDAAVLVTPS